MLDLYEQMELEPNHVIYIIVLTVCAQYSNDRANQIGKQILQQIPPNCPDQDVLLTSGLKMLMKLGDISTAEYFFQAIQKKELIAYSSMMYGYRINDQPLKCFEIFEELKQNNLVPDEIIFSIIFGVCSDVGILSRCKYFHSQMPSHFKNRLRVQNALINMWVSIININY